MPALRSSSSVRALILLGATLALGACATAAPPPPPVPEAVPPIEPAPPPPEPEPPPPEPEPPPPPPEAPKGSIEARSLYPQVGLADWTLANGLRVVFKNLDSGAFVLRSTSGAAPRDTEAVDLTSLDDAMTEADQMARLGVTTLVLVGPADADAVEGWVGARLSNTVGIPPDAVDVDPVGAPLAWQDLPAAFVLRSVLDRRESATLVFPPSSSTPHLFLAVSSVEAAGEALRPVTDSEARAARDAIEVDAALWAETLAFLYAEPGDVRPARRPEAAADLLDRLGAVPPSAVNALLDRLRDSTD